VAQPTDQTGRTRTVVIVVTDERGIRISGTVRGVVYSTPQPLSADAAYLRLLLGNGGQR
jgi:hypothetical protein